MAHTAPAPFTTARDGYAENEDDDQQDHIEQHDLLGEEGAGYTPYLGRLALIACLSGLQFGMDTGVVAGLLVAIKSDLGHVLSSGEQELIVSATTVGAIVGSLFAGKLSDWLGRKATMIAAGVCFLLGSLEQSASQVVRELVLGRFIQGLAVGMASMVTPTFLAEVAPTSIRGRIVALNSLLITGGQVIAYTLNAIFYSLPHGWRWMVLSGSVPAIIQLIGLFALDDSPRWLISKGRISQARKVLQKIYPKATFEQVDEQIRRIQETFASDTDYQAMAAKVAAAEEQARQRRHAEEAATRQDATEDGADQPQQGDEEEVPTSAHFGLSKSPVLHKLNSVITIPRAVSLPHAVRLQTMRGVASKAKGKFTLLFREKANRKALILACGLQFFQQACGFNSLMYFSARLLSSMNGFQNPNAPAVGIALANMIGTIGAMRLVDGVGRRRLLLYTTAAAAVSLMFLAGSMGNVDMQGVTDPTGETPSNATLATVTALVRADDSNPASGVRQSNLGWAYASLVGMIFFTLFYALGLGIVPWLVQAEVFASPVRGVGGGMATATNWVANLIISATYLDLVKLITAAGSFWLYSAITVLAWIFTYLLLPELTGVSINDVAEAFDENGEQSRGAYSAVHTQDDS